MAGRFSEVQTAPPIEVFAVVKAFNEDTFEKKVNLSIGGKSSVKQFKLHRFIRQTIHKFCSS